MPPEASSSSINDILPEETICLIIGQVDFKSKAAVLRVCKRWYTLLTYPPPVRAMRRLTCRCCTCQWPQRQMRDVVP